MANMSLADLREVLAEAIGDLRQKETSPAGVNALCNAVGKILSSVKLEMEYYKAIGKTPDIALLEHAQDGGMKQLHEANQTP